MPGFVEGVDTCAHFAQPNSLEFESGVEWRCLLLRQADAKRNMCNEHASQLAAIMQEFRQVGSLSSESQPSCLWTQCYISCGLGILDLSLSTSF